jgi:hypothetical protein
MSYGVPKTKEELKDSQPSIVAVIAGVLLMTLIIGLLVWGNIEVWSQVF